eukprot:scaffold287_cov337-Pavlova_lutheri.AAC.197
MGLRAPAESVRLLEKMERRRRHRNRIRVATQLNQADQGNQEEKHRTMKSRLCAAVQRNGFAWIGNTKHRTTMHKA